MKKLKKLLIVLFIFELNNTIYAQPGGPGGDPGAVPITNHIPLIIVFALVLAYVLINKRNKKIVK
jgi:hypothetical protein